MESRGTAIQTILTVISTVAISGTASAQDLTGMDCMIEPHSVADVSTREEGVIEAILVKRGDIVKKGQVVAKLESRLEALTLELADARAKMAGEIESRQATLAYMERQRDRIDDLYSKKSVSFNEKDKADTDVRLAQTELQLALDNQVIRKIERDRAAQRLALRSIRSPVDGVIVEILLVPGESVEDRAREIMTIAEVDPLNVEVIMPAELYGSVKIGTPAEIMPLIPGGELRMTEVAVVDRTIDAASDTFGVQLQLENTDHAIPGGVRCNIDFKSDSLAATQ
jgi:RND family efflux transporter MFP subunit